MISQGPPNTLLFGILILISAPLVVAQAPPTLDTIDPPGGKVDTAVEVTVAGKNLHEGLSLICSLPEVRTSTLGKNRFRIHIPQQTPPGLYDLWLAGEHGISSPRTFVIGNLEEYQEAPTKTPGAEAMRVPLNGTVNGRLVQAGEIDQYQFEAQRGERIVVEVWGERIDSRIRSVLEIFDSQGRRLGVRRGYFGPDSLIDFHVPEDGIYRVTLRDLVAAGGAEFYYRLDLRAGPRVAFAFPPVVERGKESKVTLFGWNLSSRSPASIANVASSPDDASVLVNTERSTNYPSNMALERRDVIVSGSQTKESNPIANRFEPYQLASNGSPFPHYFSNSPIPQVLALADLPILVSSNTNDVPGNAQEISIPCEITGQWTHGGDEIAWYSFPAKRGEVLYLEAWGDRIGAPVDLHLKVYSPLDSTNPLSILAEFSDETENLSGAFPMNHLDPSGRWVAPFDGRFLISIHNLGERAKADPRRLYQLSLRREEPDFHVIAIPSSATPTGLTIPRGGRATLELFAVHRRGWQGPIRISATELPKGLECSEVWLGHENHRGLLVITADHQAQADIGEIRLVAEGSMGSTSIRKEVSFGTMVRAGRPRGWGRLVHKMPLVVAGEAPVQVIANGHESIKHHLYGQLPVRHSPGSMVDLAIQIEGRDRKDLSSIKLVGIGLPEQIPNQVAMIAPGQSKGHLSFPLPKSLPVGKYTLVVRAEGTRTNLDGKTQTWSAFSNAVNIDVQPAAFSVEVDPFAPKKVRRGETVQIGYSSKRLHGFIGKMHTELAVPGSVTNVEGLRGRGETFVGQTDSGSIQVAINDDAPLGPVPFLRLLTVGVVEDEPLYQGSCLLPLEITE